LTFRGRYWSGISPSTLLSPTYCHLSEYIVRSHLIHLPSFSSISSVSLPLQCMCCQVGLQQILFLRSESQSSYLLLLSNRVSFGRRSSSSFCWRWIFGIAGYYALDVSILSSLTYYSQNVSGRTLVGLRFWNQVCYLSQCTQPFI
jgi:hypothetical protein